jgi:ribonuclease J
MQANAELAKRAGVPRQLVGRNGDLFRIAPTPSVMRSAVAVGRLFDDGGQLKPVA